MNYYISDTHFGHENIIVHDAKNGGRTFKNIKEHDDLIIHNWNNVINPSDNVYILGDFSWLNGEETKKLIEKLNGAKFLIKGNHDYWVKNGECKRLFQGIYDYKEINDNGKRLILSHYPILFYNGQHRGTIHLYGHVHNSKEYEIYENTCKNIAETTDIPVNTYNVGCMIDYMDYTPRTVDELIRENINRINIDNTEDKVLE